jgi:Tol biopolymer transport system component
MRISILSQHRRRFVVLLSTLIAASAPAMSQDWSIVPSSNYSRAAAPAQREQLEFVNGIHLLPQQAPEVFPDRRLAQSSFPLPGGQSFSGAGRQILALSPDGRNLAYLANSQIYVLPIAGSQPREIPGTKGTIVLNPMFAPDGESIAFIESSRTLKRVSIRGGPVSTIASVENQDFNNATWGPAGILITGRSGILRVSPEGGAPDRLISLDQGEVAYGPHMLPDGRTILFTLAENRPNSDDRPAWDKAKIVAQSLTTGTRRVLIDGGADARYLPSGHLLYAIGGTMFAAPFDPASLTLTGAAGPVIVGVSRGAGGAAHVAVSGTGTLAYVPGSPTTTFAETLPNASARFYTYRVVLGDSRSDAAALAMPPAAYIQPRVSPDGRILAVGRNDGQQSDIWTYDLAGKSELSRLTVGGHNRFPVWSADSRRIAFQSQREGDRAIFWQTADGTGATERLTKAGDGEEHIPEAWSRDGKHLLFSVAKGSRYSLWVLTLDGKRVERLGGLESTDPFGSSFSPDGRWVTYAVQNRPLRNSPETGVFVEPFPPTGEKYPAPKVGADYHPRWAPDGKSLFYVPSSNQLVVAVPVTTGRTLAFGRPSEPAGSPRPDLSWNDMRGYDVLPDGRFISLSRTFGDATSTSSSGEVRVVTNWFEELKRRVPTK